MADVDEIFCRTLRTLLSDGDLAIRLLVIGNTMAALDPHDFPPELRNQVEALRDDFVLLGLAGGCESGTQHRDLSHEECLTLAVRVVDVAWGLAVREST